MTEGRSWQGDWKERLYQRVKRRGYESLTGFANARPGVSTLALAEELGADDINAIQVVSGLLAEAEAIGQLERYARDLLARHLAEEVPRGWPSELDEDTRARLAIALAEWISHLPPSMRARARATAKQLLVAAPPGWHPLGAEDAVLVALFPDE